jgi:hypothetical protein
VGGGWGGGGGHILFMQAGLRTGRKRITVSGIPKLHKLLCNFYGTQNLPGHAAGDAVG